MRSRRSFLDPRSARPRRCSPCPARAFEFQPYDPAAVEKAIASGKPVVVHVRAWWCLQCHAQAAILDSLKGDPAYDGVSFFLVDYDKQKDVVAKLDCPRATLIAYRGGKEVEAHVLGDLARRGRRRPQGRDVNLLLTLPLALAAGMLTIFSPCVLPLAPIVVAARALAIRVVRSRSPSGWRRRSASAAASSPRSESSSAIPPWRERRPQSS